MHKLALLIVLAEGRIAIADVQQPSIPPATAAAIPEAGRLVSYETQDPDALVIARITRSGPVELQRIARPYDTVAQWMNATTLVVVTVGDDHGVEVRWFVDGKLDAARSVKHSGAVWAVGSDEIKTVGATAFYGPDGAIYVEKCLALGGGADYRCKKGLWLRADGTPKLLRTKPAKVIAFGAAPAAPAKVKAPGGITVKLTKARSGKSTLPAITCSGPSGSATWTKETPPALDPEESFVPRTVRWTSASPPLYAVDGTYRSPGETQNMTFQFRACDATPLEGLTVIADGMWASTADDKVITVRQGDQPIAVFAGKALRTPR